MRAILDESVDLDLWKAVRIDQGSGTQQLDPGGERWLTAALDRAAGDVGASSHGDTLFEAAGIELYRFLTAQGRETGELRSARESAAQAEGRAREARDRLERFEGHLEEAERFRASISTIEEDLREATKTVGKRSEEVRGVERLERECEQLRTRRAEAETELQAATREHEARVAAIEDLAEFDSQIATAADRRAALITELEAATRRAQVASESYEVVKDAAEEAESMNQLRITDFEHRRDMLDRDTLRERLERIDTALISLETAEATLQGTRVDVAELQDLKEAELGARIAEARRADDAAYMEFSATAATAVEIDGESVSVPSGEPVRLPVLQPDVCT